MIPKYTKLPIDAVADDIISLMKLSRGYSTAQTTYGHGYPGDTIFLVSKSEQRYCELIIRAAIREAYILAQHKGVIVEKDSSNVS